MDSTVELDDEKVTPFNDVIQNRRFIGKLIYLTIFFLINKNFIEREKKQYKCTGSEPD